MRPCCGIYADNNIAISNCAVTVTCSDMSGHNTAALRIDSYGIQAKSGGVIIDNATVNASGGAVTDDTNIETANSYGIYAFSKIEIKNSSSVTARGGTARTADSKKGCSYGLYAYNDTISISASTVNAHGGGAEYFSSGIYTANSAGNNDTVTIESASSVTATGASVVSAEVAFSYGIRANKGITISGSKLDAISSNVTARGSKDAHTCGIIGNYFEISGNAIVSASAGTATGESGGVRSLGV